MNILALIVPAGEYWVGDPCYAVPDLRWMEWLEAGDYESNPRIIAAPLDGKLVVGVGTKYGDGYFKGSDGFRYPVDAGLIGVVPVSIAQQGVREDLMTRVTFEQDFRVEYDEDGTITIGRIQIDTDPEEYFEDEDEDEL